LSEVFKTLFATKATPSDGKIGVKEPEKPMNK
jgi:hypothetical protein